MPRATENAPPVEALQICGEACQQADACLQGFVLLFVPRERITIHGALLFSSRAFEGHLSAHWIYTALHPCAHMPREGIGSMRGLCSLFLCICDHAFMTLGLCIGVTVSVPVVFAALGEAPVGAASVADEVVAPPPKDRVPLNKVLWVKMAGPSHTAQSPRR